MCVVSLIGDHYNDKWKTNPFLNPPPNINPNQNTSGIINYSFDLVTKSEFEALRKEVLEMKELLKRAVEYDKKNNQPHCEMDEKVALLKKIAELVGVSLDDIFKK